MRYKSSEIADSCRKFPYRFFLRAYGTTEIFPCRLKCAHEMARSQSRKDEKVFFHKKHLFSLENYGEGDVYVNFYLPLSRK